MDEAKLLDFETYRARRILRKYPILEKAWGLATLEDLVSALGLTTTQEFRRKLWAEVKRLRARSAGHPNSPDVA